MLLQSRVYGHGVRSYAKSFYVNHLSSVSLRCNMLKYKVLEADRYNLTSVMSTIHRRLYDGE